MSNERRDTKATKKSGKSNFTKGHRYNSKLTSTTGLIGDLDSTVIDETVKKSGMLSETVENLLKNNGDRN